MKVYRPRIWKHRAEWKNVIIKFGVYIFALLFKIPMFCKKVRRRKLVGQVKYKLWNFFRFQRLFTWPEIRHRICSGSFFNEAEKKCILLKFVYVWNFQTKNYISAIENNEWFSDIWRDCYTECNKIGHRSDCSLCWEEAVSLTSHNPGSFLFNFIRDHSPECKNKVTCGLLWQIEKAEELVKCIAGIVRPLAYRRLPYILQKEPSNGILNGKIRLPRHRLGKFKLKRYLLWSVF